MNRDIGFFAGMFRDTRRLEYYRRFLDSVAPSLSRKIALFNNRTIMDINLDEIGQLADLLKKMRLYRLTELTKVFVVLNLYEGFFLRDGGLTLDFPDVYRWIIRGDPINFGKIETGQDCESVIFVDGFSEQWAGENLREVIQPQTEGNYLINWKCSGRWFQRTIKAEDFRSLLEDSGEMTSEFGANGIFSDQPLGFGEYTRRIL